MRGFLFIKNKRILFLFCIILLGTGIGFFLISQRSIQKIEKTAVVRQGVIAEVLLLSGEINASEKAILRFQAAGKIANVNVREGDIVKKYQTIASLDQRALANSIKKELNDYLTARWTFEQTKDDNKIAADTAGSQTVRERARRLIDQAQFSLDNSVLDVEAQDLAIQFTHLTSPIDGIVTRVDSPQAGVNIIPTQAEFEVVNPASIYFEALADQTEVAQLRVNEEATITLDAYPETTVSGRIQVILFSPKQGEVGTVYPVRVSLPIDNESQKFRLGMTGDIEFITKKKENTLIIPLSFVTTEKGKRVVTIKKGNKKEKQEVETGIESDEEIEILSGLSAGDVLYD